MKKTGATYLRLNHSSGKTQLAKNTFAPLFGGNGRNGFGDQNTRVRSHTHEYVDVRKKVNRKMIAGFSSENRDDALDQRFVRRATIHHRLWFFHFFFFFYYYF